MARGPQRDKFTAVSVAQTYVCDRERERERDRQTDIQTDKWNVTTHNYTHTHTHTVHAAATLADKLWARPGRLRLSFIYCLSSLTFRVFTSPVTRSTGKKVFTEFQFRTFRRKKHVSDVSTWRSVDSGRWPSSWTNSVPSPKAARDEVK